MRRKQRVECAKPAGWPVVERATAPLMPSESSRGSSYGTVRDRGPGPNAPGPSLIMPTRPRSGSAPIKYKLRKLISEIRRISHRSRQPGPADPTSIPSPHPSPGTRMALIQVQVEVLLGPWLPSELANQIRVCVPSDWPTRLAARSDAGARGPCAPQAAQRRSQTALLRQLCLPLRGVWALTSSELPWAVPDGPT